jgi:hypothetical protein
VKLSIIVVNFNSKDFLSYTLKSIKLNPPPCDYEVIVIDNGSTDHSLKKAKDNFPEFTYIENKNNPGYGAACNQGANIAKGELLIFSNADVVVTNGAFEKILEDFENNPKLGALGPRYEYPDGKYQPSCRRYPRFRYILFGRKTIGTLLYKNNPITREFLYLDLEYQKEPIEVEALVGAFIIVPREIFKKIKGFDTGFFLFAEDIDLCLRIKKIGYKIIHDPRIRIVHFHGQSRRYLGIKSRYYLRKSIFKFFKKHNSISPFKNILLHIGMGMTTALSSVNSIFYKNYD